MTFCVTKARYFILGFLWWAGFATAAQAMTLSEALQRAAQHDPAVASSLATFDAEKEAGPQERAGLLPTVTARGAANYADTKSEFAFGSAPAEAYPSWQASLEARQPLFRLDWFARRDRANAQDALAENGLNDRKQQLFRRVADRYFNVLLAQDEVTQLQAQAKAVQESLDNSRNQYEVGLVPGTDLREAQAKNDLTQAQLLSARRAFETAQDALDETTGTGRETLPSLSDDVEFPALLPADQESWMRSATENSAVLIQARQQSVVAMADVKSRKSAAMPTVDLVASASHSDSTKYTLGQLQDDARVGVELTVPLFAGGLNASRVREAEARQRAAEAELLRLTLETERQVRQLFRDVQSGYVEVKAYRQAMESAALAEIATQNGYEAGTRTILDVLDAKSRVAQSKRDLHRTRYNQLSNLVQLKQAAGVLSEKDFAGIDQLLLKNPAAN
jgi:TolC family type I secretion outer membrane protein